MDKRPKRTRVQVSLKPKNYDLIKKMAENDGVSMSTTINMLLYRGLKSKVGDPDFMKLLDDEKDLENE